MPDNTNRKFQMFSYIIKGELGDKGGEITRNFRAKSDEDAYARLAVTLGLRPPKEGKQFKRRNRKKTFKKIPRLVLAKFGKVSLWRDNRQVFPKAKHRERMPRKDGVFRNRRPMKHVWLLKAA